MKLIKKVLLGASLLMLPIKATMAAPNLLDVYQDALANDLIVAQAMYARDAEIENLPIAESVFFPTLSAQGRLGRTEARFSSLPPNSTVPSKLTGNFSHFSLTARQTLFNYQRWKAVKAAGAQAAAAEASFNATYQDLIIRVASAYFALLFAEDTLDFTQAELRANERRLSQSEQRFEVGLVAITAVDEAKAARDIVKAREIAAQTAVYNAHEDIKLLTNQHYESIAKIQAEVPLVKPDPLDVEEWIDIAIQQNYLLQAAQMQVQSARENISVQSAARFLTVNASVTADHTYNELAVLSVPKTRNVTGALEFSLPLLQGGEVFARTRQATSQFNAALANRDFIYRQTKVNTKKVYNDVISGISQIEADIQALNSSEKSLGSVDAQYNAGTRTMVDVLDAQRLVFERQTFLSRDRINYIVNTLRLKQLAGTLSYADLMLVNEWLSQTKIK